MKDLSSRVIEAAAILFRRFGFKKTSVDEIAREAGVAKSTLYQHYRSKEELLLAVVVHEARSARAAILDQVEGIADPLARLRRLGELGLASFREKPFTAGLLNDPTALFSSARQSEIVALAEGEMIRILVDIIEEGQEAGAVRDGDARTMAYLFLKVFQSFTFARTGSLPCSEDRRETEERQVLDMLIQGIAREPGAKGKEA